MSSKSSSTTYKTMKILLISGKAQAGKTTTANFIVKAMNESLKPKDKKAVIINYGDLLKYICKQYFDWDGSKNTAGRTLLQEIGTEVVRAKYKGFWVDFAKDLAYLFDDYWSCAVIGDCRFKNEIDWGEYGDDVKHIRIVRPNHDNGLSEKQKNHPSETDLDDVTPDCVIVNDGTLEDLEQNVRALLESIV